MNILAVNTICQELSPILRMFGQILNVFKISLPMILIVLGIFDIGKSVISSKKGDVKKSLKNFTKRLVISVSIFFVPLLCMVIFNFVDNFKYAVNDSGIDFDVCYNCLFKPGKENCNSAVEIAVNNP